MLRCIFPLSSQPGWPHPRAPDLSIVLTFAEAGRDARSYPGSSVTVIRALTRILSREMLLPRARKFLRCAFDDRQPRRETELGCLANQNRRARSGWRRRLVRQ